ncbi:nitrate- and nitrite sensing domain-containing protein [Quisquiliibacterium transsilvanicum]|uniref:ANTAR domain-containing protein n=1 Tax=Quisquiliibacterium transsilvanicum TaxID=1549638 RepID=A0A7W8HJE3_9BURK|nr:hypothetical protein [Quisquiliibacterium transsilvanicum]
MKSTIDFLIAAKRCEIAELGRLAKTSALVDATASLVHELQRERGLSNLYLGSGGVRADGPMREQRQASDSSEAALRACLDRLDIDPARAGNGARLFARVAQLLCALDALPGLRAEIDQLTPSTDRATAAYVRLVAGLLAVVFEAADSAADPGISRQLVALFNFMQGKEFAGQERAAGTAMLAGERARTAAQQRLLHLIDAQERCLAVFADFAGPAHQDAWQAHQAPPVLAGLERLRRILCTAPADGSLDNSLGPEWFEACSQRIDRMRAVEKRLADALVQSCHDRSAAAQTDLLALDAGRHREPAWTGAAGAPAGVICAEQAFPLDDSDALDAGVFGPQLVRSILDLAHEQARRLRTLGAELDTARSSLEDRKLIERAKGLLMAHRQLTEEEAHRTLRRMAMERNRRLAEVAEAVLAMAELLPVRPR